ncbi:MAG: (2Fe-2S) ferredoxin domain-containing protein [Mariprofundaceae bacterium]
MSNHALIEICQGPECGEYGGPELLAELTELGIAAKPGHCQGLCHEAPMALINDRPLADASVDKITLRLEQV